MKRILLVACLLLLPVLANAAEQAPSFSSEALRAFNSVQSSVSEFSSGYTEKIQPIGTRLLILLSIITLSWSGFQMALSSSSLSQQMSKMFHQIFMIGFASYLMSPAGYHALLSDFTTGTSGLEGLTNNLAQLASPSGSASLGDSFINYIYSVFKLWGTWWDKLNEEASGFQWLFNMSFNLLMSIVLMIGYLITSALGVVAACTAIVMAGIAFALGPFFIPFMVSERTSFLFDGWIKFTFNACLTKVIIAILLGLGSNIFTKLLEHQAADKSSSVLGEVATTGGSLVGTMLVCLLVSGVISQLMLSASGIAGAITSGGSIGSDGFAGRLHGHAKVASRNASVQLSQKAGAKLSQLSEKVGGATGSAMKRLSANLSKSSTSGNVGPAK